MVHQRIAIWQLTCQNWHVPSGSRPLPSPLSREVARILSAQVDRSATSQASVADRAGISRAQLSRILSAQKVFTLDQLDAVCIALECDIVDVLDSASRAIGSRREGKRRRHLHPLDVGGHRDIDLRTVELDAEKLAASTDNTPIDPSRGEA